MLTIKGQLLAVKVPKSLLVLPAMVGVCQPLELGQRIRALGHFANEQLGCIAYYQQRDEAALVTLAGQHFIFSCYQLLSMMVALQCWSLFHQECVEQRHIIIDNLTGVMAPEPAREMQAATLAAQLFKADPVRQTARRVYQFTSAFLHSYPHLCHQGAELHTAYRDLDGRWHHLGPWPLEEAVAAMANLLLNWQ